MNEIIEHFTNLGVKREIVIEFLKEKKAPILHKISKNLPSKEEFDRWCKAPKNLETLRKIKFPLLCGWTTDEITIALMPYVNLLTKKYVSCRNGQEDCQQDGCIGIIHALRTDAGIASFASHAYNRIRTAIRRSSATSGVISKPERMPSKTEVRRAITNWFLDKDLVSKEALREVSVQKIGRRNVTEMYVPETLRLRELPINLRLELYDFVQSKFDCPQLSLDSDRVCIIGDLIQWVASSPDFNGMPVSLSSSQKGDEDRMIDYIPASQSTPDEIIHKKVVHGIIMKLSEGLTPSQKVVFEHSFGLNGKEMLDNHEIADSFSRLSKSNNNVSRQRVTQYSKAILRKLRRGLLDIYRSDIEDRYFEKTGSKVTMEDIREDDRLSIMEEVLCSV
jgi:RNA polymerase sigma factor (sigma-70 family)